METKMCIKCGVEKPLTREFFHIQTKSPDGFRARCSVCRSEDKKEYLLRNKEKPSQYYQKNRKSIRKKAKKYYELNKDKIKDSSRAYYNLHKEEILAKEKSKPRNLIKLVKSTQKRKSLKKQLLATFTVKQWADCQLYFENMCAYCGSKSKLTQDHFVPLSKGGEYTVKNIIPACKSCNCSKHTSDFFDWYPKKSFYSRKRENKILKYLGINNKQQQTVLF